MNKYKNTRFYKACANGIFEFKILRLVNENKVSAEVTKACEELDPHKVGERFNIDTKTIEDTFVKLTPDGYIDFSIVELSKHVKDVMVVILRDEDIRTKKETPYAVCRQSCLDLFAKQTSPEDVDYSGISISVDTCPAGVDIKNFFACEKILYSEMISYYICDSLSDIINMLKDVSKFNDVLEELFQSHVDYICNRNRFLAATYDNRDNVDGYYRNINDLLKWNNFQYDLFQAFKIIPTTFSKDELVTSIGTLTDDAKLVIGQLISKNINKTLVISYERDIDLSKVHRSYCLVADKDNNIYVVAYSESPIPYTANMKFETRENLDKLKNNFGDTASLTDAMQHIQFLTSKYSK